MKLIYPGSKTANGHLLRQVLQDQFPMQMVEHYTKRITYKDLTAAATTQTLTLTGFPTDVWVSCVTGGYVWLVETFGGGGTTASTLILGDAADDDELVTSQNVFVGQALGLRRTTGAANFAIHYEAAFVPQVIITSTTANVVAFDQGEVDIVIPFVRNLSHAAAT